MLKKAVLLTCFFALLPFVAAYGGDGKPSWGRRLLNYIDTLSVRGIDRNYIGLPEKPWQVVVRGSVNQANFDMNSTINGDDIFGLFDGEVSCDYSIRSGLDSYVGVWGAYRGYGISYSHSLNSNSDGSLLKLGVTGGCYGLNYRHHHFVTDECEVRDRGSVMGYPIDTTSVERLISPIHFRSLIVDGYYLFNGKRFSYSAAYDQSAYQLRSAGSFMVGAMYYYSHIDYTDQENMDIIFMMDDVGEMRQWQVSVGAGYAYNYVPAKGVLISGMLMPMLTGYNRLKSYRYNSLLKQLFLKNPTMDLEALMESDEDIEMMWPDENRYKTTETSHLTLNFNARLSLTYNLGERAYLNTYGQVYNFRFSHDQNHGALTEWFVNAALGFRF